MKVEWWSYLLHTCVQYSHRHTHTYQDRYTDRHSDNRRCMSLSRKQKAKVFKMYAY